MEVRKREWMARRCARVIPLFLLNLHACMFHKKFELKTCCIHKSYGFDENFLMLLIYDTKRENRCAQKWRGPG